MSSYLRHQGILAFAHRGGTDFAPENTLAAFTHAVGLGFRYLETDVHASADGVLYAFHDPDLSRLLGTPETISSLTSQVIDTIRIDGRHAIPRMAALLEQFPTARFNIDAKAEAACDPLVSLVERTQCHDRICIGSFADKRIHYICRRLSRPVCHSIGMRGAGRFWFGGTLRLPQRFSATCVQFPVERYGFRFLTREKIAYAHRLGLQVHAWTINDESLMHDLLDIGVDGIMTDACGLLKKVLIERNLWGN
jgi:glycerophosphoryl diester phosphodiesterase